MTEYAIISDIHANYPALRAVVEQSDYDELICLGDIVGLNAFPKETVGLLREEVDYCIAGNHDVAVVEYGEGHVNDGELSRFEREYTHEQLTEEQKDWINSLGTYGELRDKGILIAHAKPYLEESSGYKMGNKGMEKGDVIEYVSKLPDWIEYVLTGHTHEPYVLDCSKFGHEITALNPGSLGYDGTYIEMDTESEDINIQNVEYDTDELEERLRDVSPKRWW